MYHAVQHVQLTDKQAALFAVRRHIARTLSFETNAQHQLESCIKGKIPPRKWKQNNRQDMQCTYNVILRSVRARIVAVEKQ